MGGWSGTGRSSVFDFDVDGDTDADDDVYWINSQEVESIAALPGATAHLVALLRRAVGGRADGVDLGFEGVMPRSE